MFGKESRTYCIVTGASRGFGRAVALALASEFLKSGTKGCFVLVSRSEVGLEETRDQLLALYPTLVVHTITADLGDLKTVEETYCKVFAKASSLDVTHALLVNNVGTLGDVSKCLKDLPCDASMYQRYFDLNLVAPMLLTSQFLQALKHASCSVVNISSLRAVKPHPFHSLYCTGKAARDMTCQVVAMEEPSVRVLNYAPGPLLTDMLEELRTCSGDSETRKTLTEGKEKGTVLTPDESARKLINLLKENAYTSGAHVDYYDI